MQDAHALGSRLAYQFSGDHGILNIFVVIYAGLGGFEEPITGYKKAIELKPNYTEAYNNLGNALHALGRSKEAITNSKMESEILIFFIVVNSLDHRAYEYN